MSPPNKMDLLSGKPMNEFSPEEYKIYVRSLFQKRTKSVRGAGKKASPPPFIAKLNKAGRFYFKLNRKPGWMSRGEVEEISRSLKLPLSEVWVRVFHGKSRVDLSTQEEQERIKREISEIPWRSE